jgi:hypothetical protein
MSNPWFRMYTDFLNDPKMIALAFEDQRHFIGILALKSDGALDQECDEKLRDRIVAQRLWLDYATIGDVKKRLVNAGLIDSEWQPLAWDKRQFKSDKDNTAAERQRRYRESQTHNALRNGTVTRPDTDTDTDTEQKQSNAVPASIDQSKKSEKKKEKQTFFPEDFAVTPEMFDWAVEQGLKPANIKPVTLHFKDHHESRGNKFVDWNAAWRTWMRNSVGRFAEQRR